MTGMTYTDEAMKVWRETNDACTTGWRGTDDPAAAAVITAAMAEKDEQLRLTSEALMQALEVLSRSGLERAAHEATKAELKALREAIERIGPETIRILDNVILALRKDA